MMKSNTCTDRRVIIRLVLLLFFYCPVYNAILIGQTNGVDFKTINVDELSDDQILRYIKQAEDRGLSQVQVEAAARQKGMSEVEIIKLRDRILRLKAGLQGVTSPSVIVPQESMTVIPDIIQDNEPFGLSLNEELKELSLEEKRVFGFGLFKRNSLTFAPNLDLPTPVDYDLGPGDELIVDLWGSTQQFLKFTISREGTIRLPNIGPIYINGLTIKEATKRVIDRLSQIYSGLRAKNGESASIFYQVSLGNIRTINVEVIGSVQKPGIYSLPSLATAYTALHAAGGPTLEGTFRNIRVIRDNKLYSNLDLYTFLTQGIKSGDVRLKNGDVLIIPPYETRIALDGEVKLPGLFEMKDEESILNILKFANGFNDRAFKKVVTVRRNGDTEKRILDVSEDEFSSYKPVDGDEIFVGSILEKYSNRVVIDGAVFRRGEYELTKGLTLTGLISKAQGLRPDAYQKRATIYRIQEDYSQVVVPVDLGAVLDGSQPDIPLFNEDIITINSIYDLGEEPYVQITGEVLENGVYPFFHQMTVQDLVVLAGGLKESASGAFIEIARRNRKSEINSLAEIISLSINEDLSLGSDDRNMLLEPFDQVYIRISPGYGVQENLIVEGEVMVPGSYAISKKEERVSDIISRAKGLTPYAYARGAILIRRTEFEVSEARGAIGQKELTALRNKVLSGQSALKNIEKSKLLSRIDKLRAEVDNANSVDMIGSRFKRSLIQQTEIKDSLTTNLNLKGQEPVTLDLNEIMNQPGSKYDLTVRPGDVISIPAKLETVRVTGEVTSPLNARFDDVLTFKDYIDLSGGFMHSAMRGRSYIQYPNGERRGVKRFLFFKKYPRVDPGSTIVIARKSERKALNLQTLIALSGSLASVILVADRIGR